MLCTNEVASILGCTKRNVIRLVSVGQLTPVNNHERFFLFDEKQVLNLKSLRNERR
jgi:hypothetical protein